MVRCPGRECAVKKVLQILWLFGAVYAAAAVVAQEEVPAAGVAIPELDVAENVRRMLDASRKGPRGAEAEPVVDGMPVTPVPPPTIAPPPAVAPPSPTVAASIPPAAPAAPPAGTSNHVPLPAREFTIRDMDDIRALARELEEAKRHR